MDSVLHKILTDAMDKKASDVSFCYKKTVISSSFALPAGLKLMTNLILNGRVNGSDF